MSSTLFHEYFLPEEVEDVFTRGRRHQIQMQEGYQLYGTEQIEGRLRMTCKYIISLCVEVQITDVVFQPECQDAFDTYDIVLRIFLLILLVCRVLEVADD